MRSEFRPFHFLGILTLAIIIGHSLASYLLNEPPGTSEEPSGPSDVVTAWAKTFPHERVLAALLTTETFREGHSFSSWAERTRPAWEAMRFRYLKGHVRSGWIKGENALVVFESTASSVWGTHVRQEQYQLVKGSEGRWFIDDVKLIKDNLL